MKRTNFLSLNRIALLALFAAASFVAAAAADEVAASGIPDPWNGQASESSQDHAVDNDLTFTETVAPAIQSISKAVSGRTISPPPSSVLPGKALPNLGAAGDMIAFSRDLGDGVQAITVISSAKKWMAVYHIDSGGQIRLTSSRPIDADFTIQFNATSPLPEEIRRLRGK